MPIPLSPTQQSAFDRFLADWPLGNVFQLSAGSGLTFESLGPQRLKGLPEEVDVYRVTTPASGLTP